MVWEFTLVKRVEFCETDMAGIVHFSYFFRYMEMAEHAFFRSLGYSIVGDIEGEAVGWPRVHADFDYYQPLRFEDEVEITLMVREVSHRSIHYLCVLSHLDGRPDPVVAVGRLSVACVQTDPVTGRMRAHPIPAALREKLEPAPAENCALYVRNAKPEQ